MVTEGASVVITDVLAQEGRAVARDLGEASCFIEHDVSASEEWTQVVTCAEQAFGPVSVLVNNAAIVLKGSIETLSEADFRRVADVNLMGVFLGMKAVVPSMQRAGKGSIINMSSIAAIVAWPDNVAYVASKWAVRGITKAAALDLAPHGIRVNSVHPGLVDTAMTAEIAATDPMLRAQPIARKGRPEELAQLVVFLASDESSYSTGAEFVADGGYTVS
jgi:3alpha(or 20beta)-hydroxysteroid dehydrogenase